MWIFGRKADTPESLSHEVFGFFDKFRALQTRIQSLVDVKETEMTDEKKSHGQRMSFEQGRHERAVEHELAEYDAIVVELTEDLSILAKSMVVAEKIVNFAEAE